MSRIQYPTNLRVIRVMCSGRVEPSVVLGILADGADGVMIMGCHIGDCHYIDGNLQAKRKYELTRRLVEKSGLSPKRLRLEWVSASEGQRFADLVVEFIEQVKEVGPSPLAGESPDPMLSLSIQAARAASERFRLRALVGKEEKMVTEGNVYGEQMTQEEFDEEMNAAIESEYARNLIHLAIKHEPSSVKALAEQLGIGSAEVLGHVVAIRQLGWVDVKEIQGSSPVYMDVEVPQ